MRTATVNWEFPCIFMVSSAYKSAHYNSQTLNKTGMSQKHFGKGSPISTLKESHSAVFELLYEGTETDRQICGTHHAHFCSYVANMPKNGYIIISLIH
jgi:hypothetical protein